MVDLADEKLEAEIEKLRAEISSLSAEKEKANQETERLKIETKYAVRGFGYWFIEGLKIFAAGVLGFGGLTAAISGYTLGSAQKEMLLVEKEKAQKELKDVQSELEGAKKQLDNARTRKVVADYALGDALVQLELAKNKLKAAKTSSSDSAGASIDDAVAQTEKAKVSVENLKTVNTPRGDDNSADLLTRLRTLVSNLFGADASTRDAVYVVLSRDFRNDPNLVTILLEAWQKAPNNESGIYYMEALFLDVSPAVSRPKKEEILKFIGSVQSHGGVIQHLADLVRGALEY